MLLFAWRMGIEFHGDFAIALPASALWILLLWLVHRS